MRNILTFFLGSIAGILTATALNIINLHPLINKFDILFINGFH